MALHSSRYTIAFAACFVALYACSLYGESDDEGAPPPASNDAGSDAVAAFDSAESDAKGLLDAGEPACDPSKPFGSPREVPGINTPENELNLWSSEDEKTVYVTAIRSAVAARYDVYTASRASTTSAFGALVAMNDVNVSDSNTSDPTLTADGLTIIFASQRPVTSDGGLDLFTASRSSATTAFGAASALANVNGPTDEQNPFLVADGLELFWNVSVDGGFEMLHAVRGTGGSFGAPETAGLGNPSSNPVLSRDGLTIFYAVGSGADIEIWTAHRSARGAPFIDATRVAELSSPVRDVPQWLSPDGCRLYFMSNREGGPGGYDQWVAERGR